MQERALSLAHSSKEKQPVRWLSVFRSLVQSNPTDRAPADVCVFVTVGEKYPISAYSVCFASESCMTDSARRRNWSGAHIEVENIISVINRYSFVGHKIILVECRVRVYLL
jgi:hypothetical protein